jgi:hypothetical protein
MKGSYWAKTIAEFFDAVGFRKRLSFYDSAIAGILLPLSKHAERNI